MVEIVFKKLHKNGINMTIRNLETELIESIVVIITVGKRWM